MNADLGYLDLFLKNHVEPQVAEEASEEELPILGNAPAEEAD